MYNIQEYPQEHVNLLLQLQAMVKLFIHII